MNRIDPAATELPPTQPIDITDLVTRIAAAATGPALGEETQLSGMSSRLVS